MLGAIVGGGILALAGVAFATTGPGAMLAFALNGGIAFLTVASFSELAARFPHSGGTYTYAKRVLSIEAAFLVGWVVWFASIVAGVLYARPDDKNPGIEREVARSAEVQTWLRSISSLGCGSRKV